MAKNKVIIGTRGSRLALWQAEWVRSELQKLYPDLDIELNKIKTTGDKILDVPLAEVGGKGLFVKEIEEALLSGKADLAVHSMKDVPTEFPERLHLSAICKREDPRDAFISQVQSSRLGPQSGGFAEENESPPHSGGFAEENEEIKFKIQNFKDLQDGATIGTSSLRRSCQLLNLRPDLSIKQLRGNLDTRIRKLEEGQFDAIILAVAGLKRLGWAARITEILEPEIILPAIGQGAIGIECRIDDEFINKLIAPLNHPQTSICVKAERVFLKKLEGGCQVPIAAHARIEQRAKSTEQRTKNPEPCTGRYRAEHNLTSKIQNLKSKILIMDCLVSSISGDSIIRGHCKGEPEDAEILGIKLAEDLLSRGAGKILAEVYGR